MRYCEISKEMSSLFFGLAVFCPFEARLPEFDKRPLPYPPPPHLSIAEDCTQKHPGNSGTPASNLQDTSSPNITTKSLC